MNDKVTLRLTLDVTYELTGDERLLREDVGLLRKRMRDVVSRDMGEGNFTRGLDADIDVWRAEVEEVATQPTQGGELRRYVVLYHDKDIGFLASPFAFICDAEDALHAEEQCEDAYPGCDIVWVYEGSDRDDAYDDYNISGLESEDE